MVKRCWACAKELGVAHYCATDIKGVYCDADCLEAQRNKVRFAAPRQEQAAGEWVDVNDRIPEFNEQVLVCDRRTGAIDKAALKKTHSTGFEWHRGQYWLEFTSISHWQPLPAPPVIQKDETGQCGACEHWVNPIHGGEFGTCQTLTYGGSPYLYNNGVNTIRTNKGFGCIEFQAKDG